jgi:hypothetical protein
MLTEMLHTNFYRLCGHEYIYDKSYGWGQLAHRIDKPPPRVIHGSSPPPLAESKFAPPTNSRPKHLHVGCLHDCFVAYCKDSFGYLTP